MKCVNTILVTLSSTRLEIFLKYEIVINNLFKGLKYWSCCQRKTTEFQQFLDQEGCEIGVCKWIDDKGEM